MKKNIVTFVQDVGNEMKRVTWPSKAQLQESTLVTIGTCLIISAFVYVVDLVFTLVVDQLF